MLNYLKVSLETLLHRREGATIVEYALLAVLIGAALVGVIVLIAPALSGIFTDVAEGFEK